MISITYPSALVPAPPRIRIDVPDDWEQLDRPQLLVAARETGAPEAEFVSNVTIRHLIRPTAVTEVILFAELRDFVHGKDQGVIGEPFQQLINGTELHGTNLSYVDQAAGTLAQVHVFARRVDGPRASIVQLVATFGGARRADVGPVVRGIVQSLQIEWPTREPQATDPTNPC